MAKKNSTSGLSFDAMLGQNVVPGSDKKKKDQLPIINLTPELSVSLKKFIDKKKEMKEAESEMRLNEQPLLDTCLQRMDKDALGGDFHSSYEVKAEDGTRVKFITVDKFNISQEADNVAAVRDLLGEHFEVEIVKQPTVVMKDEVYQDEKLQKELVSIMGEKFSKFFETRIKYTTKEGFDERMYKIAGNQGNVIQIRSLLGKNKPFLK